MTQSFRPDPLVPGPRGRLSTATTRTVRGAHEVHDRFLHEAFLWRGDDEFLAGTVPFIREGLGAGQPVMVAVIASRIELLRAALGTDADPVRFVDAAVFGRNPAQVIPAWREFVMSQSGGQPVRGIGEPIWPGRRPAEVLECQLQEALLNVAIEPHTPLWLICPYDVQSLAPDLITEAQRSHPVLVVEQNHRGSILYGGPQYVATIFEADLPNVEDAGLCRTFGYEDLYVLREDVKAQAQDAGLSPSRSADLALAVHEVAVNSLKHGSGERVLRIWIESDSLVCEVHDYGHIADPMIGRTMPARDDEKGRGLWMAYQLSDLVQVRSSHSGTSIRIHSWL